MDRQLVFVIILTFSAVSLLIRLAIRRSGNADRLKHLHKDKDPEGPYR